MKDKGASDLLDYFILVQEKDISTVNIPLK